MNGLGGRNEPQDHWERRHGCWVSASPSYQYLEKKTSANSLEWTSEQHCLLLGRAGVSRARLRTCQSSLWNVRMSTAASLPHEGGLASLGTHTGLPLWFFLEYSHGCLFFRKEEQFHTEYILGVDNCPSLELFPVCGTQRPSWPFATSQSRWVSLSERDTQ